MANPKRRFSNSRTKKRRSHDFLVAPAIPSFQRLKRTSGNLSKRFVCPQCKHIKLSHTVCHNCGYYRDRQVVAVERV
ncbi:MAG TPA: 50S ribosomal protein L32 [Candidatus Hypogeohydataceae bacterium YC41]